MAERKANELKEMEERRKQKTEKCFRQALGQPNFYFRFTLHASIENEITNYDFREKFERTVHQIVPSVTVEPIQRTEPVYITANPLTAGLLDRQFAKDERYYV